MTVEIESILQHEDIQGLLENAEGTGSVKQPELAELIEAHQLDALETDAVFNELERRGIEVLADEQEKEKEKEPAPPPLQTSYETTTDALQLFLREAGRHPLLTAAQEVELAEEASLPIQQAHEVKAAARASASLDQPVGEAEDAVFGDFVAGDDPLPEEEVEVSLRSQALTAALLSLQERERQVLVLRYGLDDSEPKTLEEIGRRLGLTRERVRQIELESLRRLSTLREMQSVTA